MTKVVTLKKKMTLKKFLILWLPVTIWMGIIFLFSSMQTAPVTNVYWSEFLIKKSAHVVEYFTLCSLLYRAFLGSEIDQKRSIYYALFIAIMYASLDEFHQSFTPGREPKVRDILIDSGASVMAVYLLSKYLPNANPKIQKWAKELMFL